ncbi:LLM class flavin-dependent oxidoreductase [Nonomuraea antimicrobica]
MSTGYGHPLRFGVLLTPGGSEPEAAVERARLAEELGYDLVSFLDEPAGTDPWTLLSWVAARTSRVRLAAGVGPEADPAVAARGGQPRPAHRRPRRAGAEHGRGGQGRRGGRSGREGG